MEITRENERRDDLSKIYVNLEADDASTIVTADVDDLPEETFIRLTKLLYGDFRDLAEFPDKYHEKMREYRSRIEGYNFPVIEVRDIPIDIATEVFTRINRSGKPLTMFEIMVAKTYGGENGFDLSEEYSTLINDLEPIGYDTIPDRTVLQLVALILKRDCRKRTILNLDKNEFMNTWPKAVDGIERAAEYMKNVMRIPVSELLPYHALIVPFSYFFHINDAPPDSDQERYLNDFFWRCSLSSRYSSADESKLARDIGRIEQIADGQLPGYDWGIHVSPDFVIEQGKFSVSRSFIKAILCVMTYQCPLSFNNNGIVNISNHWLKQANSKNYHHFFPKAFLRKQDVSDDRANNVVNITIVDGYLNRSKIGSKPPSQYMKKFKESNPKLSQTMETHLIGDLGEFGIWDDDYDAFVWNRAKAISEQLKQRIIWRREDDLD